MVSMLSQGVPARTGSTSPARACTSCSGNAARNSATDSSLAAASWRSTAWPARKEAWPLFDLVIVGRREERLAEFADGHPEVKVRTVAADLSTSEGVDRVAGICATVPLTLLVNNAGIAHYMPLAGLPAGKAAELMNVKVLAPTMLARATVAGMQERGAGTIVNVAGMIAFSGPAPRSQMSRRAVYAGTLAYLVAMSQTLSAELEGTGVAVQVVCPGVVATEFHERQGLDLSAVPRMSADDVVTASLRGLQLGETVCAPGVEETSLLDAVFQADLAAFGGQSRQLAGRYRD